MIREHKDDVGLLELVDGAMHELVNDADDQALPQSLQVFTHNYFAWRVTKPKIIH